MISVKEQNLRDLCLFWGCPGVVFLSISMFVALKVGADFQQDSLAKWTAFLLCNFLLWILYVMFQSTLVDLLPTRWKDESFISKSQMEQDSASPNDKTTSENVEPATELCSYRLSSLNLFNTPNVARSMSWNRKGNDRKPLPPSWTIHDTPCHHLSMMTGNWRNSAMRFRRGQMIIHTHQRQSV